jgi:dihydrofolate synthase/folylpolyglutamate synthase
MTTGGAPHPRVSGVLGTPSVSADFNDALEWLYGFSDMERGVGWNARSNPHLEWNLRRTRVLLDLAGAPDRTMICVLVAGTKGKGSTATMLARILSASGIQAGLYTKPHLQSYRERIRVDGVAIEEAAFAQAVDLVRPLVQELGRRLPSGGAPTTFELTTVVALSHFAARGCRVAVVEVGLGGRLDATNAVDPHVSVITSISHDHTRLLGSRLSQIASEKAGVLRPGRVAILAPQDASVRATLLRRCAALAAEAREIRTPSSRTVPRDALALRGDHQRVNAAVALAAAGALREHGVAVRTDPLAPLRDLRIPGRFEIVPGEPVTILDGAHNDGSAIALARALEREYPRRRVRLVIGVMADKDARAVVKPLLERASAVFATRPPGSRGLDARTLARLVRGVGVTAIDEPADAVAAARSSATRGEVVCVTGSLALVGRTRDVLGLPIAERLW